MRENLGSIQLDIFNYSPTSRRLNSIKFVQFSLGSTTDIDIHRKFEK